MQVSSHMSLHFSQQPMQLDTAAARVLEPANATDQAHNLIKPVAESTSAANLESQRPGASSTEDDSSSPRGNDYESETEGKEQAKKTQEERQALLDQQQVKELSARDREVRAHEQAHMAVGGQYAGSASYTYERGPNGVNYAVGGEVAISTGREATPEQTIRKAQVIRRAAMAPAEPSPADRQVASSASQMEADAKRELLVQQRQEAELQTSRESDTVEPRSSEPLTGGADSAEPAIDKSTPPKEANTIGLRQSGLAQHYIHSSSESGSLLNQMA